MKGRWHITGLCFDCPVAGCVSGKTVLFILMCLVLEICRLLI